MIRRNYAMEIATALAKADSQSLAQIGFELLESLGEARANLATFEAEKTRSREYDRERKRRVRRNPTESTGNGGPSPVPPTPPFNPTTSPSSSSAREAKTWAPGMEANLAQRLVSDADRNALTALLHAVRNKAAWVMEVGAMLDGMPGHRKSTPEAMGVALRQYVLNGKHEQANAAEFDAYVRRAMNPPPDGGGNGRAGPGQRVHDKIREALG